MDFEVFRRSDRPSLGVELELQLVDSRSMALRGASEEVLARIPEEFRDSAKPEFYRCCVEINTGICQDVEEVGRDLGPKLRAAEQAAASQGLRLAWGGTHPFSHWREQPIVPTPRYQELADQFRETLCRQLTFGLHVHVGVEDGDAAVRACDGIREHLPALLALSANSPFWCGRATGLLAHRIEVMGASPIGGLPPRLRGWDEYCTLVDRLADGGFIKTSKELWWDVRPSPGLGTVEVRICDMPADLPSVLGLTALIQCLVHDLARGEGRVADEDACVPLMLQQNRWRAARYGMAARLVDPRTGRPTPARQVVHGLLKRLRGVAEGLGCCPHLRQVLAMAEGPTGAERQLAVYARTGDLAEVARHQAGQDSGPTTPARDGRAVPRVGEIGTGPWPGPAAGSGARDLVALG